MDYFRLKKKMISTLTNRVKGFVRRVSGIDSVTLDGCVGGDWLDLNISGNSLQDGTPTPEAPIEVISVGDLSVNILPDAKDIYNGGGGVIAHNYKEVIEDGRECISFTSARNIAYDKIKFKENTQYTFSFDCKDFVHVSGFTGNYDIPFGIWYTDGDRKLITIPKNSDWTKLIIVSDANKTVSHIGMISFTSYTTMYIDINTFQIEEGTTATPYEPYGKYKIPVVVKADNKEIVTNIFLNEPLRKIGDYADYIDFKNKKVVRNTFVRVYDGYGKTDNPFNKNDNEENWAGSENHGDVLENFWLYTLNDVLPVIPKSGHHSANDFKQVPMCLQLPVKTGYYDANTSDATVDKEMIWFSQQARCVRVYLSKDRVGGTRSNFLTYLRSNPISVVIATYQPYEEPLNIELPQLPAQTVIVEIDTELAPTGVEVEYYSNSKGEI